MVLPPQGGSWAVYKDGDLADSGAGLAGGARVRGGGLIVVGQVSNESTASAHVTSILISDWLTGAGRGRGQVLRRRVFPRPPDPPGRVGSRAGGRGGGEAAAAVRAVQRRPRALASGLQRPPGPHQGGRRDTGHLNIVIIQISPLNFCNECPSLAVPENAEIEVQGECRNVTWYVCQHEATVTRTRPRGSGRVLLRPRLLPGGRADRAVQHLRGVGRGPARLQT